MRVIVQTLLFVGSFFICTLCLGEPLGTTQVIEDSKIRFIGEFGSDLWTSPLRNKRAPIRIYRSKLRIPVKKDEVETASVYLEADGLSFGRSDITLGKNQVYLGSDFRDQKVGFGLERHLVDGSSLTLFGAFASASDLPYESGRDSWLEGMTVYRRPKIDSLQWIFAVDHTKNRGYLNGVALPYAGAVYTPSEDLRIVFGFPFFRIDWTNQYDWQSTILITPVTGRFSMNRTFADRYVWEINAALSVRSYLHANRIDPDERIFSEHKFLESGFRTDLSEHTSIRFILGGSFDRRIYEAKSIFHNDDKAVRLDSDFYGRLGLELRL